MIILTPQALAELSEDELKTLFVQRFPVDPEKLIATKDQLIDAILRLSEAA